MELSIINGLMSSKWKYHRKALTEVGVTALVSFFPLTASALTLFLMNSEAGSDTARLFGSLAEVVSRGELVVYASSIIAPVFYLCLREPPVIGKISQFIMALIIFLLCCVMYTLNYSGVVKNVEFLVDLSYALIAFAIFVWYISTLFREMTYNPNLKEDEVGFSELYAMHRTGGEE